MIEIARLAWKRWKIVGDIFGDFQARLLAVVFYFTAFVPYALGVRLFSDPLALRSAPKTWLQRAPVGNTLDDARRQF